MRENILNEVMEELENKYDKKKSNELTGQQYFLSKFNPDETMISIQDSFLDQYRGNDEEGNLNVDKGNNDFACECLTDEQFQEYIQYLKDYLFDE